MDRDVTSRFLAGASSGAPWPASRCNKAPEKPMIQRLSCLQRRDDISHDQFCRHWRETHGALAAKIPHLLKYQQNHVIDARQRVAHLRGPTEVGGFAQLWFPDEAAMKEASRSPEHKRAFADLPEFVGAMSQYAVETNPVVVRSLKGKGVKRMTMLYAKDGVDFDRFRFRWFEEHAALVAEFPNLRGYLQHLITDNLSLAEASVADAGIRCAGIVEMWFDHIEAMEEAFRSPPARSTLAHGDAFLGAATTYMVEEFELI